jgi:hypothetical protein
MKLLWSHVRFLLAQAGYLGSGWQRKFRLVEKWETKERARRGFATVAKCLSLTKSKPTGKRRNQKYRPGGFDGGPVVVGESDGAGSEAPDEVLVVS